MRLELTIEDCDESWIGWPLVSFGVKLCGRIDLFL